MPGIDDLAREMHNGRGASWTLIDGGECAFCDHVVPTWFNGSCLEAQFVIQGWKPHRGIPAEPKPDYLVCEECWMLALNGAETEQVFVGHGIATIHA